MNIKIIHQNNQAIIFIKKPSLKTFNLTCLFDIGSSSDPVGKKGLAHLSKNMILRGSKKHPTTDQLFSLIEDTGGSMSLSCTKDNIILNLTTLNKFKFKIYKSFEQLYSPSNNKADLIKEKSIQLAQIEALENDSDQKALINFNRQIFQNSYYRFETLGLASDIDKIKINNIRSFQKEIYSSYKVFVFTSNFIEKDYKYIVKLLKKFDNKNIKNKKNSYKFRKSTKYFQFIKKDIIQPVLVIGSVAPYQYSKEFITYNLLRIILGTGFGSRAFMTIRNKLSLAYYTYSFYSPLQYSGLGGIISGVKETGLVQAFENTLDIINQINENRLEQSEIDRAKGFYKGILKSQIETGLSLSQFYARQFMQTKKIITSEKIIEMIDSIKKQDLVKLSQKYFSKGQIYSTLVFRNSKYNQKLTSILKKFNEKGNKKN